MSIKPEVAKEIEEIKKSNWQYFKKSSICKFKMKRCEIFKEYEEAITFCELAILYESYIDWPGRNIEIKGLKGHLKYLKRKGKKWAMQR
jgi:hypothetical protein